MNDARNDDAWLQAQLAALPRERTPPSDGWARLLPQLPPREPVQEVAPAEEAAVPAPVVVLATRRRPRWAWPLGAALAASVVLFGVAPWRRAEVPVAAPTLLQQQADVMAREYHHALAAMPVEGGEWLPALHELDRSAEQIRAALAESPRSAGLLRQLQRTYALRLELTRQAALAAAGLTT